MRDCSTLVMALNNVCIIVRFTRDPEVKYSQSGMAVCRFSVAINRGKDKDGNDRGADFPNCIAFGKTAETIGKFFTKGRMIGIVGRIQTGSYEKDGVKRTVTEIIASDVEFLTARDSQGDSSYNQREYSAPARKMAPMPEEDSFTERSDEDLPF